MAVKSVELHNSSTGIQEPPYLAYLGIDPGKSGYIVHLSPLRNPISVHKLNQPLEATLDYLQSIPTPAFALLEKVQHLPGDGAKGSFTFGESYGQLKAALLSTPNITLRELPPTAWQTRLGCRTRGNKSVTYKKALDLFPDLPEGQIRKVSADAYLLAYFAVDLAKLVR